MNTLKNNRGVTLVFIALFLFLLLMFLGVAVDIGWTTIVRTQAQRRVDAAALAAVSVFGDPTTTNANRQSKAQTIADTFAGYNKVVSTSTNPTNTLTPMNYNYSTHALTTAADWTTANANAVKVTNTVSTPLFFSAVRNVFGASETGSTTINVSSTAYLGCPGTEKPTLPLAICHSAADPTNAGTCDTTTLFQQPDNNSAFFGPPGMGANAATCKGLVNNPGTMPNINTGDVIDLTNGQLTSCLKAIEDQCTAHNCSAANPWCVTMPVFDGTCNGPLNNNRTVLGFADFCITQVSSHGSNKFVEGHMKCPVSLAGPSGGTCFGVYNQNPVLVQ